MDTKTSQMFIGRAYGRTGNLQWDAAILDFLGEVLSSREEKTERFYAVQLTMLARWAVAERVDIREFAARHMRTYLVCRGQTVSDTTRRHDAVAAKQFFAFCSREGYVAKNPLADYKVPKAPTPYVKCPTEDELITLLQSIRTRYNAALNPAIRSVPVARRTFLRHRNTAIIAGLIETGCRVGELLGLLMADYDPLAKRIAIRKSKTDQPRTVPITSQWVDLVSAWLAVRPKRVDADFLFIGEYSPQMDASGQPLPMDVGDFSHLFARQVKYAGLEGITLHSLRHYAATRIANINFQAAMVLLGHSQAASTRRYTHPSEELVRNVQDAAGTLSHILQNKSTARSHRRRVI